MASSSSFLAAENLCVRLNGRDVLSKVTFAAREGLWAVIGANGSGKSTLLRALMGIEEPHKGNALLLGFKSTCATQRILAQCGFSAGGRIWPAGLRVDQLLEYFEGLYPTWNMSRAREIAQLLQLPLGQAFGTLSQGNQKKVGIISACAHTPRVVMLDEPFAHLDERSRASVPVLLHEMLRKGSCILVASHDFGDVKQLISHGMILRDGRLVWSGSLAEWSEQCVVITGASQTSDFLLAPGAPGERSLHLFSSLSEANSYLDNAMRQGSAPRRGTIDDLVAVAQKEAARVS